MIMLRAMLSFNFVYDTCSSFVALLRVTKVSPYLHSLTCDSRTYFSQFFTPTGSIVTNEDVEMI